MYRNPVSGLNIRVILEYPVSGYPVSGKKKIAGYRIVKKKHFLLINLSFKEQNYTINYFMFFTKPKLSCKKTNFSDISGFRRFLLCDRTLLHVENTRSLLTDPGGADRYFLAVAFSRGNRLSCFLTGYSPGSLKKWMHNHQTHPS